MSIQSFSDKSTEEFFTSAKVDRKTGWSSISKAVKRKLDMIHYAAQLNDLRSPPANRLETLRGDLVGYHSIRINDQWRIVFRWTETGAYEVRITDYH